MSSCPSYSNLPDVSLLFQSLLFPAAGIYGTRPGLPREGLPNRSTCTTTLQHDNITLNLDAIQVTCDRRNEENRATTIGHAREERCRTTSSSVAAQRAAFSQLG